MNTLSEMQAAVITEGGVDTTTSGVTEDTVTARLNDRYIEMVVRARWRRAEVEIGTTVADQPEYAVSDPAIRELMALRIGTARYSPVGQEDLWDFRDGTSGRTATKVFAQDFTSAGVEQIEFYAAPDTDGDTIYGLAVLAPAKLVNPTDNPIVPEELVPKIVDGTISTFLARVDERQDEAAYFEQSFEDGVEKLRRRRNSRFGAGQPSQIQIAGVHFAPCL